MLKKGSTLVRERPKENPYPFDLLRPGINNNFQIWRPAATAVFRKEYGNLATVWDTLDEYIEPPVRAVDFMPVIAPDEVDDAGNVLVAALPALDGAQVALLRVEAEKRRNGRIQGLKDNWKGFWELMMSTVSEESKIEIATQPAYQQALISFNPNVLTTCIIDSHLTQFGGDPELEEMEREILNQELERIRQHPSESLGEFFQRFEVCIKKRRAAGCPEVSQPGQGIKFMMKLDTARHGSFVANSVNTRTLPLSLSDAYKRASTWVEPVQGARGFRSSVGGVPVDQLAHVLVTDVKQSAPRDKKQPSKDTNAVEFKGRCDNCDEVGHPYWLCKEDLPPGLLKRKQRRAEAQAAFGRGGRGGSGGRGNGGGRGRGRDERPAVLAASAAEENMAAYEDEDDYGIVFVIGGSLDKQMVLLDSQSSDHIFHDTSFITDVQPMARNRTLVGINGEGANLVITQYGELGTIRPIGISKDSSANILSRSLLKDTGHHISYDDNLDVETLIFANGNRLDFARHPGPLQRHYSCSMEDLRAASGDEVYTMVTTVTDNQKKYTVRENKAAIEARRVQHNLGTPSTSSVAELISTATGTALVPQDFNRADDIYGRSIRAVKGKSTQRPSVPERIPPLASTTQQSQIAQVDIFYVEKIPFLHVLLVPMNMSLVSHIASRTTKVVGPKLKVMLASAKSHTITIDSVVSDNEGAVAALVPELNNLGIPVEFLPPGVGHCSALERRHRTIKERIRGVRASSHHNMPRIVLIFLVLFIVRCVNLVADATSVSRISPHQQFTGQRFDVKRDAAIGFGDYLQATEPNTNNSMASRTVGCIALLPTGSSTGSVKVLQLGNGKVVTRDLNAITILPMPTEVIQFLDDWAEEDGMMRGGYIEPIGDDSKLPELPIDDVAPLPLRMPLGGGLGIVDMFADPILPGDLIVPDIPDGIPDVAGLEDIAPQVGVVPAELGVPLMEVKILPPQVVPPPPAVRGNRMQSTDSLRSLGPGQVRAAMLTVRDGHRAQARTEHMHREDWKDRGFAMKVSVKAAIRERGEEARGVIEDELRQIVNKKVWHGIHRRKLPMRQRRAILRSTIFLKDKYHANGDFEKYKARLVAGGDQQDKELYEDLSSPTVATSSVLTISAIAAAEGRKVMVIDIGGAFLNSDISSTGVLVHMRLDKLMTSILVEIDPSFSIFVEEDGSSYVQLDKALYGTVEAAKLWYDQLRIKLEAYGFVVNPYDPCVFNKDGPHGNQITVCFHVDDILSTSINSTDLDDLERYIKSIWNEITVKRGDIIDYLAMTFDFTTTGMVRITMDHIINNILDASGVDGECATPATSSLFDIRDAPKLSATDASYFRSFVAKVLYVAKRVKPECLTAVAFLSTRVEVCDEDDLAKLHRLIRYLRASRHRGIALCIGDFMDVSGYIDAAYGVHTASGRSHTGCSIVIGNAGPVYVKSSKQKIVTKSSTEAELVALSDTASQVIHLRNFIISQGYEVGPAIIYQDNLSCMALMKKGAPCSDRSRHINIRHFWIKERVDDNEVIIEHLGTENMFANILTKPVQGAQFIRERHGLTNWE